MSRYTIRVHPEDPLNHSKAIALLLAVAGPALGCGGAVPAASDSTSTPIDAQGATVSESRNYDISAAEDVSAIWSSSVPPLEFVPDAVIRSPPQADGPVSPAPPDERINPAAAESAVPPDAWKYVKGRKLDLRSGRGRGGMTGKLTLGARLRVLSDDGKWLEVEEVKSGAPGWVPAKRVVDQRPPPPRIADRLLRGSAVKTWRATYPGNCPCPYDTDSIGRSCGARSAWSRSGGYDAICYARDVPADVVARLREQYEAEYYAE